jgi:hypothetical protein
VKSVPSSLYNKHSNVEECIIIPAYLMNSYVYLTSYVISGFFLFSWKATAIGFMLIYESTMYMWKRRRQISKEYSHSQQDSIIKKKSSRY